MASRKNAEKRSHTAASLTVASSTILADGMHGVVEVQNVDATITCWLRTDGGAAEAAAGSIQLKPGEMYTTPGAFTGVMTAIAESGTPSLTVIVDTARV